MTWGERLAIGLLHLTAKLPLSWAHRLGSAGGLLWGWLPGIRSNDSARRNIAACFPELDGGERRQLYRRFSAEAGKSALEIGHLWLLPPQQTLSLVRSVHGKEAVDAVLEQGRGAIFASPHLGAWELAGLYCSAHYPMTTLYKPIKIGAVDQMVQEARGRSGARLVATDARGIKALFQTLRHGHTIGILPDQTPKKGNGVHAPFFGQPAYTMTLISRLSQKSGAPVFFCYALRRPRGAGFDVHFELAPPAVADPDPATAATALNQAVEQCIRRAPEQYVWNYRRFRRQPAGTARSYPKRRRKKRQKARKAA